MQLTEINIYPVKSTRRIALTESEVLPRGLPWDRRWMLVDAAGNFITARQHPALALVDTLIEDDMLHVSVAGRDRLSVPLQPGRGRKQAVCVWRDTVDAIPVGHSADAWFSEYLGLACRLVTMGDDCVRPVHPDYGLPTDEVSFADGFPLLLISEASLADLNQRLAVPVSMRRFRPNVVVSGCQAYAEDNWRRLRIGEVEFAGVKACSRCIFTTIDPDTGRKDPGLEPLRTLSRYRRRDGGVYFGQNLIPRSHGSIRLGDRVDVIESA